MTTTRIKNDEILAQLANGTKTVDELASALRVAPSVLQYQVDMLFYSGRIRVDARFTIDTGYCLAAADRAPRAPLDTPAAGPRLAPNLQSTLAGYDREISRRVELAMTKRGK